MVVEDKLHAPVVGGGSILSGEESDTREVICRLAGFGLDSGFDGLTLCAGQSTGMLLVNSAKPGQVAIHFAYGLDSFSRPNVRYAANWAWTEMRFRAALVMKSSGMDLVVSKALVGTCISFSPCSMRAVL